MVGPQQTMIGDNPGSILKGQSSKSWTEEVTYMDKYIIERRAKTRLAWFKRCEEISNISQLCRESGISRKTFYKWWSLYAKERFIGFKEQPKRPKSHLKTVPEEIASKKPLWTW